MRHLSNFLLTVFSHSSASLVERAGILNQSRHKRNQNIHPLLEGEVIHLRGLLMKKNSLLKGQSVIQLLNVVIMVITLIGARMVRR